MKKILIFSAITLLLTSCSGNSNPQKPIASAQASFASPSNCKTTKILSAFPASIPNPQWIDTNWQPAVGTDLEAVYNAGGIACTYGLQSAEIGGTFTWAPNTGNLYQSRIEGWKAGGQVQVDIENLNEDSAYVISDSARNAMEIPSWSANILINDFWISIGGRFIQNIKDALVLIKAAVASLQSQNASQAENIKGCYVGKLKKDVFTLKITSHENSLVKADISYLPAEKDSSVGTFLGNYTNGILDGMYTFNSEGTTSIRELIFKGNKTGFVAGYGAPDSDGAKFVRPLKISWDKQFIFEPTDQCT